MHVIVPEMCPRARLAGLASITIIVAISLAVAAPTTITIAPGEIASAGVTEDYDAARARLAGMLTTIQGVEGLVPQASVAPVVAILNLALDKLELAIDPTSGGFTTQASANISAANLLMNGAEAPIAQLVAQASATRTANAIGIAIGIGISCAAIVLLAWIKRRHDKKQLQTFLSAEIDYSNHDAGTTGEEPKPGASTK